MQHRHEGIDLLAGVVEGQGRPHRGFLPETAQDGLGAVVAGAHRDAFLVERLADRSGDLIFAAATSGKYTQDEVFAFGERFYNKHSIESFPQYWTEVVNADILDADGLYKVAMRKGYQNWFAYAWVKIQELAILVLSKHKLNAEQVMNICKDFDRFEISMAAIKTGVLSDDQILSLKSTARSVSEDFWGSIIPLLRLDNRTVSDLIVLGKKANSDKLWPSITKAIDSKKAIRA